MTHRSAPLTSLLVTGAFVATPLVFIAGTAVPAAAADTICIAGEGTETSTYDLPQDAVGVRAFLSGEAGDGFVQSSKSSGYVRPGTVNVGGRGALLVTDIPVAGGTTLKLGTLAGGGGGARRGTYNTYNYTPIQNGGDAAYLARVGQQCNNLLAVAAGGGGAGGAGQEESIKTAWPDSKTIKIYTGTNGGDAGNAVDGFVGASPDDPNNPWDQPLQARAGQETDLNSAKDGGVGGGATSTGGGRGTPGHQGDGVFNLCKDGFFGTEGTFLRGGLGGPSALPGTNCDMTMGAAGGGAGYFGGGGGGSAGGMATSGSGGGGSSFLAPGGSMIRASLTGDTTTVAPKVIPIYQPTLDVTAESTDVAFGATAKLTATLGKFPADGGGTVTFYDGWTQQPLAGGTNRPVVNGKATLTTAPYNFVSKYQIYARYSGRTDESSVVIRPVFSENRILPSGRFGTIEINVLPENFPITVTGTWPYRGDRELIAQFGTLPHGLSLGGRLVCTKLAGGDTITDDLDAGTYSVLGSSCSGITKSGANASKFNLVYAGGGFTITRPNVDVQVDGFHTFGTSDKYFYVNPNYYARPAGITAGGDISCTLTNGSDPASPSLPVGSYPMNACTGVTLSGAGADNYDITVHPDDYFVGQAEVGITVAGSGEYRSPTDGFTYSTTPLPDGVTVNGTISCTTIRGNRVPEDSSNDAGVHNIDMNHCSGLSLNGPNAGSYSLRYVSGKYTMRQKPFPISIDGSQNLGGTGRTFTASADQELPPGITLPSIPGQDPKCTRVAGGAPIDEALPYSETKYDLDGTSCTGLFLTGGSGTHVGSYKAVWSGQFKVNLPPPVQVRVSGEQTYGDEMPRFTSDADLPPGIELEGEASCTTANNGIEITPDLDNGYLYDMDDDSCSGVTLTGLDHELYEIEYRGDIFAVGQAVLTIKASDVTAPYRGQNPTPTPEYSGFLFGDDAGVFNDAQASAQPPFCYTTAFTNAVGSFPGNAKCGNARTRNYEIEYVEGDVTITKLPLHIKPVAKTVAYGDPLPTYGTLADVEYAGFEPFDNAVNSLDPRPTCTSNISELTEPGVYDALSSCSGGVSNNYDLIYDLGKVTITGDLLTVTAPSATITYGDDIPDLSTPTYKSLEPVSGEVDEDPARTQDATCSTDATSSSPAGTYPVTCEGAEADGNAIQYLDGTLTITKAPLTITASDGTGVYKGTPPTITPSYDGFVNGDDEDDLDTLPTCSSAPLTGAGVHPGTATCSGAASYSYEISYVAGTVTVAKRPLTITASAGSSAFGQPGPTITPSYDGFASGDNAANSLGTAPSCQSNTTATTAPGSYPATSTCTGATSENYELSYAKGTVTVGKAALTVTAPSPSKGYGAAVPGLAPSYSGFVNDDDAGDLTGAATCSTTATAASAVETYPVTCSDATSDSYTFSYVAGTLTVTKVDVTVTAPSPSKAYGAAVPALAPSYSGFVNDDDVGDLTAAPSCATTATAASAVGTYPVTCTGATSGNYTFSYVAGTLTITAKAVTVTAPSPAKTYGADVPALAPTYSGFVDGEDAGDLTAAPSCSTTATASSAVGSYPVTCAGATSGNYSLSYVAGSLTVTKKALTITAGNAQPTYGDAPPAITPAYDGFVNGDDAGDLTTPPTCSANTTTATPAGLYLEQTTCSGAVSPSYEITYAKGNITVTKAPVVVTAGQTTKVWGVPGPTPIAYFSGLRNGETKSALDLQPTCVTTVKTTTPVGDLPGANTCSGAGSANYAFSYVAGTAKVVRATLNVVGTPITVVRSLSKAVTFRAKVTINASGRPASGIRITFTTVSLPKYTLTCTAYTNAQGIATCTKANGASVIRSPKTYRMTGPATTNYFTRTSTASITVK